MYVVRFPYTRGSLQRPASLTQLLAYLFNPKQDTKGPNHRGRLAGPPWGCRVIQRASPFGDEGQVQVAARDLAQQFFHHIHEGVKHRRRPYRVYVHLSIGFPLDYAPRPCERGRVPARTLRNRPTIFGLQQPGKSSNPWESTSICPISSSCTTTAIIFMLTLSWLCTPSPPMLLVYTGD